ncbi:outer membrane lipoprotein carrier protein LolA [bacterium]|nr:outer membrane lipoprotein carrier protein LolA [bacterium]
MRKLLLISMLILWSIAASAQNMSPDYIINKLKKTLKQAKTLDIAFSETYIWKLAGETSTVDGIVLMKGERQFKIKTADQIMVSDGTTVWTYIKPDNRVLIDEIGENDVQMAPYKMLFQYSDDYDVQSVGKELLDKIECAHLVFTAKTEAVLYPKTELWINLKTWLPVKLLQIDFDDNESVYRLKSIEIDKPHLPKDFEFQMPDGAEVIDLRV